MPSIHIFANNLNQISNIAFRSRIDNSKGALRTPVLTACATFRRATVAIGVWVGYDDNDEIKVELTYPAIENCPFDLDSGLTDVELDNLESIIYESINLLDSDIPRFASDIYDYLNGVSPHSSLVDPLFDKWKALKQVATEAASNYKYALTRLNTSEKASLLSHK